MTSAMSFSPADDSTKVIRVGLVGFGLAGSAFHAPLIATTRGLRLDIIVTSDATRRADAARAYPGVQILDAAEALWRRAQQLDLVVLATPTRPHAPLSHEALAVGLPVVVDKPFAAAPDAARALIADARERKLMLTVYQNRRWDGDFLTVRQREESGAFGTFFRFESRFERRRPTPKVGWRERPEPAEAGGIPYDLGGHLDRKRTR